MASENVSARALHGFDEEINDLYDVVALLDAAAQRLDEVTPMPADDPAAADAAHNTQRLVQMARQKSRAVADVLFDSSKPASAAPRPVPDTAGAPVELTPQAAPLNISVAAREHQEFRSEYDDCSIPCRGPFPPALLLNGDAGPVTLIGAALARFESMHEQMRAWRMVTDVPDDVFLRHILGPMELLTADALKLLNVACKVLVDGGVRE